jgi:hypothetical protein
MEVSSESFFSVIALCSAFAVAVRAVGEKRRQARESRVDWARISADGSRTPACSGFPHTVRRL